MAVAKRRWTVPGLSILGVLSFPPVAYSHPALPTEEQLCRSPWSGIVEVQSVRYVPATDIDAEVATVAVLSVLSKAHGSERTTVTVRYPGGVVGKRLVWVSGTPELAKGSRWLIAFTETGVDAQGNTFQLSEPWVSGIIPLPTDFEVPPQSAMEAIWAEHCGNNIGQMAFSAELFSNLPNAMKAICKHR